jgi:hypothetical protein
MKSYLRNKNNSVNLPGTMPSTGNKKCIDTRYYRVLGYYQFMNQIHSAVYSRNQVQDAVDGMGV